MLQLQYSFGIWLMVPEKTCFYAKASPSQSLYVRFNMHEPRITPDDFNQLNRHYKMVVSDPSNKNIDGREVSGHSSYEVKVKTSGEYRLCAQYFEYRDNGSRLNDSSLYRLDIEFSESSQVAFTDKQRTSLTRLTYSRVIADMIDKAQQGQDWHRKNSETELMRLVNTQKFLAVSGVLVYALTAFASFRLVQRYLKRMKL